MRRLLLAFATSLFAVVLLVPPAWADWVWPLRGEVITPYRNGTDPYSAGQHRGIDIAGEAGAPVVAAAGGEVRFAGTAGSSGLTVSIRTADGRYDTSYLHLASATVREGDRVGPGHRIGTVGTSGTRSATAPHLHFGIRDAGSRHAYHDPLTFLPPPSAPPQDPRATPAPQPAPAPANPAPAPAQPPADRAPVAAPHRRRVPVGAPNPRRVPVGAPNARHVPVGAPNARRVPVGAPDGRRSPVAAPIARRAPVDGPDGRRVPHPAPDARSPAGAPHARHASAASRPRPAPALHGDLARPVPGAEPSPSPGPDLGLLLACVGLVAAAAMLGLSRDGRKATRATRSRVVRALDPLLGRR
jgi:Peptidase family M23